VTLMPASDERGIHRKTIIEPSTLSGGRGNHRSGSINCSSWLLSVIGASFAFAVEITIDDTKCEVKVKNQTTFL
jgi:hypothetical protein